MPPEMVEALSPNYVAPLVVYLGSEECKVTKQIFEVGAGWIAAMRWQQTMGVGFPRDKKLTPEDVAARFAEITDFSKAYNPATITESTTRAFANAGGRSSIGEGRPAGKGGVTSEFKSNALFATIKKGGLFGSS